MTRELLTKEEKDVRIYNYFKERMASGRKITQAAYDTMRLFNITAYATVYNIRKRVERRMAEAEAAEAAKANANETEGGQAV